MERTIWTADVTQEQWDKLTEQDMNQICEDLDIYWEQLLEEHLDKGGTK